MPPHVVGTRIVLTPMPTAHFGAGAVAAVAEIVRGTGCETAVIVTDQGLARTAVVASVAGALTASGMPATVFSEVHANPTTGDVAAGAEMVAALAADGLAAIRSAHRGRTGRGVPGDDEPSGRRSRRTCRLTR